MSVLRKPAKPILWFLLGFMMYWPFSIIVDVFAGQDVELKRHLQCLGGLTMLAVIAAVQQFQIQKLRAEIEKLKRAE